MKKSFVFVLGWLVLQSPSCFGSYAEIYAFHNSTNGGGPLGRLLLAKNGKVYGTATGGGQYQCGTAFYVDPNHDTTTVFHHFNSAHGCNPFAPLIEASDGTILGATISGGSSAGGVLFSIDSSHTVQPFYHFSGLDDGYNPSSLQFDETGSHVIGLTGQGGTGKAGTIFMISSKGDFNTLHSFDNATEGSFPIAISTAVKGKHYGILQNGAANNNQARGGLFSIDTAGNFKLLYSFISNNDPNGNAALPIGLTTDEDDMLYGTSLFGITNNMQTTGIIFAANITVLNGPNPKIEVLNSITNSGLEGLYGGLTVSDNGYLYGTSDSSTFGYSTIYKINATGGTGSPVIILHTFEPNNNQIGDSAKTPPLEVKPGVFYGICYGSWANDNAGVIYKLND